MFRWSKDVIINKIDKNYLLHLESLCENTDATCN